MGDVTRVDYYNDPGAPPVGPDGLRPAALVFVQIGQNVLMQRRSDNGNWALPGGKQDPGESITTTAIRETFEETGIHVEIKRLIGIYTDPGHIVAFYRDGKLLGAGQESSIVFYAHPVGALKVKASSESAIVAWTPTELIPGLEMDPSMRRRIEDALSPRWHNVPILYP